MSKLGPRTTHPGVILREDFFPEYAPSAGSLAKALHVSREGIEKLAREQRAITADTAMRLARYFNTTPQFWMNLQTNFDLASVAVDEIEAIAPHAA